METLRKMAMFRDPGVFVVKLADKSHNLMTLEHMKEPKRTQKAVEAIRAYGKLAGNHELLQVAALDRRYGLSICRTRHLRLCAPEDRQ
jgi:(p)ppGpp synthase/HD superfamily hydrolase